MTRSNETRPIEPRSASDPITTPTPSRSRLPSAVLALGAVSLLTDLSSEMILPLLPVFVGSMPGGGAIALGWIEGIAEAIASLLKLVSGRWSDRTGKRRPLVLAGYAISSFARPLVALARTPWHVALVRAIDRTGKGLRTSPRDALIAAAVEPGERGRAFGFHRAMDHAGAVLGPLAAIVLLGAVTDDVRDVFWLAAIPGVASVVVIALFVREPPRVATAAATHAPNLAVAPDRELLRFLAPLALFTLGNASDLFLLLKVGERASSVLALPALWIGLHVVKSVSSLYAGRLADRIGARTTIVAGWLVYAAVYGALAFAEDTLAITLLCLVYGTYHGLSEGAEKALVASLAPPERRGSAFGWYHLTIGVLALPASLVFGWIWERSGSVSAFLFGAGLALAASVLLVVTRPRPGLR